MKTFRTACDPWGVTVERVEVSFWLRKHKDSNELFEDLEHF